jgi:hypothetical protein
MSDESLGSAVTVKPPCAPHIHTTHHRPSIMPFALLRRALLALLLPLLVAGTVSAQLVAELEPPALEAIHVDDLRRDLVVFASDEMRGRRAGTLDELRAAAWLAERARAAGLEPAGEDGTFFQFFHMRRHELAAASTASIGGAALRWQQDVIAPFPLTARAEAPVTVFEPGASVAGRVVMFQPEPPPADLTGEMEIIQHFAISAFSVLQGILAGGPSAILVVTDSVTEQHFSSLAHLLGRGSYALEGDASGNQLPIPVLIVRSAALPALEEVEGHTASLDLRVQTFFYPSVNVVARVEGSDPALANEHVLFSAHLDHDGTDIVNGEEVIWNGADDNGSGSVALLAIGRAFQQEPGRRSALFVWHGAEERGLLGSRLHAREPTVGAENIVAVLNADMIGRTHPDTTLLLGALPGNRNSTDLAQAALTANELVSHFVIDHTWDDPQHPQRFWQRSDHYPYALSGYPAIFFTTGLHPDYHTPADTPDLIDYHKLTRMARWIYSTGWLVANQDEPPRLDAAP